MKTWHQKAQDQMSTGDKVATKVNNIIGSMKFIVYSTIVIVVWIALNATALVNHWDPYPFILLNLCFSAFAFYASPLILLSGNLSAKRDKVQAEHQYEHQEQELKLQTQILNDQTKILEEIRNKKEK